MKRGKGISQAKSREKGQGGKAQQALDETKSPAGLVSGGRKNCLAATPTTACLIMAPGILLLENHLHARAASYLEKEPRGSSSLRKIYYRVGIGSRHCLTMSCKSSIRMNFCTKFYLYPERDHENILLNKG